jgi:hypothetical protein
VRLKSSYLGVPVSPNTINTKVENRAKSGFLVYHKDRLMNNVATLIAGQDFGGMSLQKENQNATRMATMVASCDTHCIVLDRDSYLVSFF